MSSLPSPSRLLRFTLVATLSIASLWPKSSAAQTPSKAEEQVFFSFDDDSLPWRDNLHLTLEAPKKYEGNPVLAPGPQGSVDGNAALLYGTVIKEGDKFRMWYIAQPQPDPQYPHDTNPPYRPV